MTARALPVVAGTLTALAITGCVTTTAPRPRVVNQTTDAGPPAPDSPEARVELGNRLMEQGRLDAALAEFGLALEDNPDLVEAHLGMGKIYHKREQNEIALRIFSRATAVAPDNAEAHYNVGLMSQLLGRLNEAIAAYLRSLVLEPDDPAANRDLATAYVQVGRPDYAVSYARKATQLEPDNQAAWFNLAAVYNLLGDYQEALRCYRVATELGPLDDPVLLGLADTHIKLGNFQRAANTLESVIRTRPTATAYERLGYAQFKRRDFGESLRNYRKAVELNPEESSAHNGIGAVLVTYYIQGGRRDRAQLEEALNAWRQSLRIRPDQPRIVDLLTRYQRPG